MTTEEFVQKYGDVKVKFSSYYKYTFDYTGDLPKGGKISVGVGGSGDDIYKFEVVADIERTISSLRPYTGVVLDVDGKVIDEFYDY